MMTYLVNFLMDWVDMQDYYVSIYILNMSIFHKNV